MPRRPRFVCPGIAHHITHRGNNKDLVFRCDSDRELYIRLLRRAARKYAVKIVGYCLMPNHIHLIAVPPQEGSLGAAVRDAHSDYSCKVNLRVGRCGHVWEHRYYSCPMDESHLLRALRYVDLNPVRAGMCEDATQWHWSSAMAHSRPNVTDSLLATDWMSVLGGWDFAEWRTGLDVIDDEVGPLLRHATRSGMPLGSSDFIEDLRHRANRAVGLTPRGRPRGRQQLAQAASI